MIKGSMQEDNMIVNINASNIEAPKYILKRNTNRHKGIN